MAVGVLVMRWLRTRVVDALAVGLAAWCLAEALFEPLSPIVPMAVLCPLVSLPLLWRRRFPLIAPLVGLAALFGLTLEVPGTVSAEMQVFVAAMLAFWVMGSENRLRVSLIGLGIGALIIAVGTELDPMEHWDDLVFALLTFCGSWAAGLAFGTRALEARRLRAEARYRDLVAAEALAQERARISRDVHDVVAHSVGLMVVQLGAADRVLDEDPAAARAAVRVARQIGKQALSELRGVLAMLDHDNSMVDAAIGLSRLTTLIDTMTKAGLRVELRVDGAPRDLPADVDSTVYRVLQEALTNVLKHAGSPITRVVLAWGSGELTVTVRSSGVREPGEMLGSGRGLIGMRERVSRCGGQLTAGPGVDDFELRAVLPLQGAAV